MANNRDSSKQKRARQNRAQREAREARAKAASTPAEERKAKYASGAPAETPASSRKGRGADRPKPERRLRPGDTPVDIEALEGSWIKKRMAVPGGRQVLTGTVLAFIVTVLGLLTKYPKELENGEYSKKAILTFGERFGALGYALAALVIVSMVVASICILSPNRRRIWIGCSFATGVAAALLGISFIFPVGFLVYAVMRANRIEGPSPNSRAGRELAARRAEEAGSEAEADGTDLPAEADEK